jgi:hypothetical protein
MEPERYFSGGIDVVLIDGSRVSATVTADELLEDGREVYRISFKQGNEVIVAETEEDFFEALRRLRLDLEKTGALLCSCGLRPAILFWRKACLS